jgi:AbrB family looped-hinge helix DNA binding protein
MTYIASVSNKGQVTIPIAARRRFGLGKNIRFEVIDDMLTIKPVLSFSEIKALLKQPSKPNQLSDREMQRSAIATAKYLASK